MPKKIEFQTLHATDFMSLGEVLFNFKNDTTLILGRNDDSLSADDNGAGKSSIAEALRWVLYGETVRCQIDKSLSVEHVIREGAKTAIVGLTALVDGHHLSVYRRRTKSLGRLEVGYLKKIYKGKEAERVLSELIGINVLQFANLVHLDSTYPLLFAPSTDKNRKEILSNLVDIAIVEQMQTLVKTRLGPIEAEMFALERQRDKWVTVTERAAITRDNNREQGKIVAARLSDVSDKLLDAQQIRAEVKSEVGTLEANQGIDSTLVDADIEEMEEELDAKRTSLAAAQAEVNKTRDSFLRKDIEEAENRIDSVEEKLNIRKARIAEMQALQREGKCPRCGQDTHMVGTRDIETLTSQAERLIHELEGKTDALEELEAKRAYAIAEKLTERENLFNAEKQLAATVRACRKKAKDAASEATRDIREARNRLEEADKQANRYHLAKRTEKANLNSLKQIVLGAKAEIKEAEAYIEAGEKQIEILHQQSIDLEFWKKGFGPKGVPSLFIETVLPQISSRIQKYADILTGGDVLVTLKAYRETKSKTLQEAIQISAVNLKGASVYGANSTGERNRIDMAVTLGLIEYFRDMGVFDSNLLMCDEIFDGLDNTGVEQALAALRESAIPSIVVISHHDHLKPLFPRTVYAHKKGGVTEVVDA